MRMHRLFLCALVLLGVMIAAPQANAVAMAAPGIAAEQSVTQTAPRLSGCSKRLPFDYCCHVDRGDCGGHVVVLVDLPAFAVDLPRGVRILIPTSGSGVSPPALLRPPRS
jgi:hypothetical protein